MWHYRIAPHKVRKRLFEFIALLNTFSNRNYSTISAGDYF